MNIAIDFDGTWSLDPWFWNRFAVNCAYHKHNLSIITRRELPTTPHEIAYFRSWNHIPKEVEIYYSCGQFKRLFAESIGLKIDIWIDDEPGTIEPQRLLDTNVIDDNL